MRIVLWVVLAIVAPVLAWLFFATNQHVVLWYSLFPFRIYDTLSLDLEIDGERVALRGTSACEWVQNGKFILVHNPSGYRLVGGALAGRLKSGKGVVVKSAAYCQLPPGGTGSFPGPQGMAKLQ
jgi:hypothetical protein